MNELKERGWISFRVKPEEYRQINGHFKKSACRKLSDYARKVLLDKPVTVVTQQVAPEEIMVLAKALNGIGNNFNQAVHKLHMLDHDPQLRAWYASWNVQRETLLNKVEEARKLLALWSPK